MLVIFRIFNLKQSKMLKRMKNTTISLSLFLLAFFVQSCKHEPSNISSFPVVCFDTQIQPILARCASCHSGNSGQEGFDATSYNSIMRAVKRGDPWGSKLYTIVSSPNNPNMMPPKGNEPLNQDERTLLELWILQGANHTTCDTATITTGTGTSQTDTVCFAQDIWPIVKSSCAITPTSGQGCHNGGNREAPVYSGYSSLLPYINKSNPLNSKLYRVITGAGEDPMPPYPYSSLSTDQINSFKTWLMQGAPNNDCAAIKGCDTTGTVSYINQVSPIVRNYCLGCHAASNPSGGVNLSSFTQVKYYADNLRNNVPIIDGAIRHMSGFFPMPQSGSLSTCQIRTIELWIQQGKQNN